MKEILAQIKQYKKDSILTPVFTALEVFMEMLLPFIMAKIIWAACRKRSLPYIWTSSHQESLSSFQAASSRE